jgi:hypothetical protein
MNDPLRYVNEISFLTLSDLATLTGLDTHTSLEQIDIGVVVRVVVPATSARVCPDEADPKILLNEGSLTTEPRRLTPWRRLAVFGAY